MWWSQNDKYKHEPSMVGVPCMDCVLHNSLVSFTQIAEFQILLCVRWTALSNPITFTAVAAVAESTGSFIRGFEWNGGCHPSCCGLQLHYMSLPMWTLLMQGFTSNHNFVSDSFHR